MLIFCKVNSSRVKRLKGVLILALYLFLALLPNPVSAQEPVYKDKIITFIVGVSAGGGFDQYTRIIARHLSKYIPGNPSVVVQNMAGAGSLIAANYVYNRAKPDGLTIGAWGTSFVLQHVLGSQSVLFDGRKFGYLGGPGPSDTACFFNKESGVKTMEDWFGFKRNIKISSLGSGTSTSDIPKILKVALGLPLDVIEGYKGGAEARLAVLSGEVDAFCGGWQAIKTTWHSEMEAGNVRIVVQTSLRPHPEMKDVPLAINYAKNDEARLLLRITDRVHTYQFTYAVPPGVSKDRLQILQNAFMHSLKDPELLAEAKKAHLEIDPIDGPTTAKVLGSLYELDAATIAKLKDILIPKN